MHITPVTPASSESVFFDAVRYASALDAHNKGTFRIGERVKPAFVAFLQDPTRHCVELEEYVLERVSIYTKSERISDSPGRVVIIITGVSEAEEQIELRAKKARTLGARFVAIVVPHLIRLDVAPLYLGSVDAVFYALPWVNSGEPTAGHPKCFPLRAAPCQHSFNS